MTLTSYELKRTVERLIKKPVHELKLDEIKQSDSRGVPVAVGMANVGYDFPEERLDCLKISTQFGWTVAHEMSIRGYRFKNPLILLLRADDGKTVQQVYNAKGK